MGSVDHLRPLLRDAPPAGQGVRPRGTDNPFQRSAQACSVPLPWPIVDRTVVLLLFARICAGCFQFCTIGSGMHRAPVAMLTGGTRLSREALCAEQARYVPFERDAQHTERGETEPGPTPRK